MAIVKVPKTPKKSFNPGRRPSALLLDQIRHLEWAALPAMQRHPRGDLPKRTVKTEGAAAERIAQLTELVRAQQELPPTPGVVVAVTLPPLPRGPAARPSRPKAPARKTTKARTPVRRAARTGSATSRGKTRTQAGTTKKRSTRGSRGRTKR